MSEYDQPALRARRGRKWREKKSPRREAPVSRPRESETRESEKGEERETSHLAFEQGDSAFFDAGNAASDREVDEDEPPGPARDPAVAARAAARRRSFSKHVIGVVAVSLLLCGAAIARSASRAASTNALPAAAVLAESRGAGSLAATPPSPVLATPPPPPVIADPEAPPPPTPSAAGAPATAAAATAAAPVAAREAREQARILLERGAGAAAIEAARRSVQLDPTDAEAWLVLGAAYQLVGNGREARTAFYSCSKLAKRGPVGECSALNL